MIKVIAVDFGGVYFTWNDKTFAKQIGKISGVSSQLAEKGLLKGIEALHVRNITTKQYWNLFCRVIGKKVPHQLLEKINEQQFKPINSVIKLVKKLRKKYTIVMFANQTELLEKLDRRYRFYKNFDIVMSSHIVKAQKPDRKMFQLLLKETGANPDEILLIDDSKRNIAAAKILGFRTILFVNPSQLKKKLEALQL